jgi:hypothetical protein
MTSFHRRVRRPVCRKPSVRCIEWLERRNLLSTNVLSYRYDQQASGVNSQETILAPENVNSQSFGKIATTPVDGQVYAQPLYVEGVVVGGQTHNVVYVATEHDSVYAIDSTTGAVLWHDSFLGPGITTVPYQDTGSPALEPEMGITATPVIDLSTNSIYVLANTKVVESDGTHYIYELHALDLATGSENLGGPLTIADTIYDGTNFTYVSGPSVPGTGQGSVNGVVTFNALREFSRVGMLLYDGNIYMAFGSHPDIPPAHGWLLGVNAETMSLSAVVNVTPNGDLGDIWQDGDAITLDSNGDLVVTTGNGTFDTTLNAAGFPINGDYGDSIVALAVDPTSTAANPNINGWGLKVVDYFTPSNQQVLEDNDLDLGSGGVLLLPPSAGSAADPNLMIQGGKQGTLYLLNQDAMGKFNPTTDQVVQETPGLVKTIYTTPGYFNGTLYYATVGDNAKAFSLTNGILSTTPSSESPDTFGYPGATPTISANGTKAGIVWMIDSGTKELRAYNAANLADELYTSAQAPGGRDALGTAVKFTVPTVADGEVFVGTNNSLVIYGLLAVANQNPAAQYIAAVYQNVLNRPVDAASLNYWTTVLEHGFSRTEFALALTHSPEYYQRVIEAAYQTYLGRPADAVGLTHWTADMEAGLSDELLDALFIGSDEYYQRSGGTDKAWVDAMYENLLGRQADPQGETEWIQFLANGASRSEVAYGFTASAEHEAQVVQSDYTTYLGRQASSAEVQSWVQFFRLGFSNEDVIAGFVGSDEYYARYA